MNPLVEFILHNWLRRTLYRVPFVKLCLVSYTFYQWINRMFEVLSLPLPLPFSLNQVHESNR